MASTDENNIRLLEHMADKGLSMIPSTAINTLEGGGTQGHCDPPAGIVRPRGVVVHWRLPECRYRCKSESDAGSGTEVRFAHRILLS